MEAFFSGDESLLQGVQNKIIFSRYIGGLIADQKNELSSQYSLFIFVLLYQIQKHISWNLETNLALDGLKSHLLYINNGNINWFGRGRFQIFGYSSYIYLLQKFHPSLYTRTELFTILETVEYISAQLGKVNTLNLILGENCSGEIKFSGKGGGWHGYNNLFDYLLFSKILLQNGDYQFEKWDSDGRYRFYTSKNSESGLLPFRTIHGPSYICSGGFHNFCIKNYSSNCHNIEGAEGKIFRNVPRFSIKRKNKIFYFSLYPFKLGVGNAI